MSGLKQFYATDNIDKFNNAACMLIEIMVLENNLILFSKDITYISHERLQK